MRSRLSFALATVRVRVNEQRYALLRRLMEIVGKVFRSTPKENSRAALVALTDGVDSTSVTGFDEAREGLEEAGIISYFIQVDTRPFFEEGLLGPCEGATRFSAAQIRRYYRSFGPRSNVEQTTNFCELGDFERLAISKKLYEIADVEMNLIAKRSGGKVFPAGDLTEARSAFRSVAAEIGTKYSLGYYSSNGKRDGSYRKIRVELRGMRRAPNSARGRLHSSRQLSFDNTRTITSDLAAVWLNTCLDANKIQTVCLLASIPRVSERCRTPPIGRRGCRYDRQDSQKQNVAANLQRLGLAISVPFQISALDDPSGSMGNAH